MIKFTIEPYCDIVGEVVIFCNGYNELLDHLGEIISYNYSKKSSVLNFLSNNQQRVEESMSNYSYITFPLEDKIRSLLKTDFPNLFKQKRARIISRLKNNIKRVRHQGESSLVVLTTRGVLRINFSDERS